MSERDYFSLRYTVPGFVLILVIVGLNYNPINLILTRLGITDVLGLAISITTLFASSAIGFLISQIWFAYFHSKRLFARILEKDDVEEYMTDAFQWKPKKEKSDKERDTAMGTIIDYILNFGVKDNENVDRILKFFQRKIDLYHTMSSALVSLYLGLGLGLFFRILAVWSWSGYSFNPKLDFFLFELTTIMTGVFILTILYLRDELFFEYHPMLKLLLKNLDYKIFFEDTFRKVFPEQIYTIDEREEMKKQQLKKGNKLPSED